MFDWVPEGSLAGFFWGVFLGSGGPRGPGRAFKNVGGVAPPFFEGLPGPPGPARPQKHTQKIRPDYLQVPSIFVIPARTPGIPQIGRERRTRTYQISSNNPRKSLIFEAGVGDRLATIRVSKAKCELSI